MKLLTTITLLLIGYFAHSQVIYCQGIEFNDERHEVSTTIDVKRKTIGYWKPTEGMTYERINHYWRNGIMDHYLTEEGTIFIIKLDNITIMNIKEGFDMVVYKDMERERIKRYIE